MVSLLDGLRRSFALFGPLRAALVLGVVLLLVLRPAPGTPAVLSGWALVPTLVAPILAPLVLMTLLLDALMSAVFMTDKEGAARQRYRRLVAIDLVLACLTALWWWPYFAALGK
jgi:hypothetical protein